jgi:hypothetical protein
MNKKHTKFEIEEIVCIQLENMDVMRDLSVQFALSVFQYLPFDS